MNLKLNRDLRTTLCALALLAMAGELCSQPSDRASATAKANADAAWSDAFERAMTFFAAGQIQAGEAQLFRYNVQKNGTLESDIECATLLTHAALFLRERYDYRTADVVANRALAYLNSAPASHFANAAAKKRAQAYEAAGFIQDSLLGDSTGAKASFQAAQREVPGSKGAQAGLDRIKNDEDKIARLPGGKG